MSYIHIVSAWGRGKVIRTTGGSLFWKWVNLLICTYITFYFHYIHSAVMDNFWFLIICDWCRMHLLQIYYEYVVRNKFNKYNKRLLWKTEYHCNGNHLGITWTILPSPIPRLHVFHDYQEIYSPEIFVLKIGSSYRWIFKITTGITIWLTYAYTATQWLTKCFI